MYLGPGSVAVRRYGNPKPRWYYFLLTLPPLNPTFALVSTESPRQQKFARVLQKELAELFLRDVPHLLPPGGMVSVQTVRMSPDLGQARVYLSTLLAPDPQALLALITENKSVIRKHLGRRIGKQARVVPDLHFFLDDTGAHAAHIEGLLNSLDIKPEEQDDL